MTTLQKAEVALLGAIRDRNGLTMGEILLLEKEGTPFYLGTGYNGIDFINKFLKLGYIGYRSKTGKFVAVEPKKDQS